MSILAKWVVTIKYLKYKLALTINCQGINIMDTPYQYDRLP